MIPKRHDARTTSLAHLSLFKGLRSRQLEQVAALTTGIRVPAGTTLCEEGQRGREFFIIRSGEVVLSNGVTLHDGDFFGEVALVEGSARTATAVTSQPTEVLVLSRQEFDAVRDVDPQIARTVEAAVRQRRPAAA